MDRNYQILRFFSQICGGDRFPMARIYRCRRMPNGELVRWLAMFLPVGLYHLWHERYRWHWSVKLLVSLAATGCAACMWAGALSLFARPNPVMAQSTSAVPNQRDICPLVADPDGSLYHLKDCVFADATALPISLAQAARQCIAADELCNPPRYNNHN